MTADRHNGGGLERLRRAVAGPRARAGRRYDPAEYERVVACAVLGRRLAVIYQRAPLISSAAIGAYAALRAETARQYHHLTAPVERGGLGFTVMVTAEDPYRQVEQLLADLDQGHLRVWSTAVCGNRHPLLSDDDNDRFRAVHDAFGHGGTGRGFDVDGEEAAWLLHHRMYSAAARPAMTTETRGQTNAMVYGTPPGVFRRQKAVLLPAAFCSEASVHYRPCDGRCAASAEPLPGVRHAWR